MGVHSKIYTYRILRPTLTLTQGEDAAKARELIAKAEANCLTSNSTKTKVTLEPSVH